uniref:Uncharacterized protein n=1 Tax=Oryctolagus cuniculus TaxID=9986 RepID=A0A5F9DKQ2_RABIT
MITFFSLDIRHYNSNMMYIYKRPYVHFPTIFLRQNCDHMCIIKIVFNPLPMKIFWKKFAFCPVYSSCASFPPYKLLFPSLP